MSNTVDDRIVSMQFDNAQFEKAVGQTITTLGNLDKALRLEDGAKGFSNLNKIAGTVSFSKIQNGIESLQDSFTVWGVMARRAVENVVDTIQGKLMSAINKVTLEPINDGFKEYELKMGSIQTIMASTGEDLKTVKGYLEDLNAYSDKTIYSFSDMTNNIGKFTNAGVKLEDAVNAIKGVANEAAVSGANANEASRAMYNFAQALSSGYVKLIDWKSIENANMATVGFKEALLETAVAMKTVKKNGDGMYEVLTTDANGKTMKDAISATKNFNDSLSHQWMTTEVLTQTLKQYATDVRTLTKDEKKKYEADLKALGYTEIQIKNIEHLGMKAADAATEVKTWTMMVESLMEAIGSGWATTFELIFGDFEQAKKMWTSINDVLSGIVDSASTARNNFLKGVLGNNLGKFEWQHLTQLGATTKEVREKLKELASKGGWDLDALIKKYGTFEDTLQAGWLSAEMFGDAIEATNGKIKKDSHDLTEYGKAIEQSALFAAKSERRFQNLVDAGYSLNTIYGLIKAQVRGYDITQGELTEEQIKSITTVEAEREALRKLSKEAENADMSMVEVSDTLKSFTSGLYDSRFSGRDAALGAMGNTFKAIGQVLTSVKDAIGDIFTMVSPEYLNNQLLYIYELSEGLELSEEQMHAIRSTAGKLLRPLKELTDAFKRLTDRVVVPMAFELFGAGFDLLKGGFYVFGEQAEFVANKMQKVQDTLDAKLWQPLYKQIELHVIPRWIEFREVLKDIPKYYDKLVSFVWNERSGWYHIGQDASESFNTFLDTLKNIDVKNTGMFAIFDIFKNATKQLGDDLWNSFTENSQIDDVIKKPVDAVTESFTALTEQASNSKPVRMVREIGDAFGYFGKTLTKTKLKNIPQFFNDISAKTETLKNRLKSIAYDYTGLEDFDNGIKDIWKTVKESPFLTELGADFKLFSDRMKKVKEMSGNNWISGLAPTFARTSFENLGKDLWDTMSKFTNLDATVLEISDAFNNIPFVKTVKGFAASAKASWQMYKMSKTLTGALNKSINETFGTGILVAFEKFKKTLRETYSIFKRGPFTTLPQTLPKLYNGVKEFAGSLKEAFSGLHLFEKSFGFAGISIKKTLDFVFGPDNAASNFIDKISKWDVKGMAKQLKNPVKSIGRILTGQTKFKGTVKDGGKFVNELDSSFTAAQQLGTQLGNISNTVKRFTGIELPFTGKGITDFAKESKRLLHTIDFKQFFKKTNKDTSGFFKSVTDTWKISLRNGFSIKEGRFFDDLFGDVRKTKVLTFEWVKRMAGHLDAATDKFFSYNPIFKALGLDNSTKPMFTTFVRNLENTFDQFVTKPIGTIQFAITDFERAVRQAFGAVGDYIKEVIKPFIDLDSIISRIKTAWTVFNQVTEFALKPFLQWNNDIEFGKRLELLKEQYGNFFKYIIDSIKKYSQIDELFGALKKKVGDLGKSFRKLLFGGEEQQLGIITGLFGLLGKAIKYLWDQIANSALGKFLKPIFMIDFVLRDIIAAVQKFAHHWKATFKLWDAAGVKPRLKVYVGVFKRSFTTLISDIKDAFVNNTPVDFFANAFKAKFKELHDWLSKFKWFQNLETFVKTNEVMIIFTKVIKAVGKALREIFTSSVEAGGFFNLLFSALSSIASVVFDRVGKAIELLQENFKTLKERANELSKGSGFEILINVFNFLADALLALAGVDLSKFNKVNLKVIDGIKKFAVGVKNTLSSLFSFKGLTEKLSPAFKRMYKSIKTVTSSEISFGEKLKGVFNIVSNFFRTLVNGFVINDKLKTVLLTLGGIVHSLVGAFISIAAIHIPNLFTKMADAIGPFLEKIKLKDRLYDFADGVKTLFDKIQNGGAVEFLIEKFKDLVDAIKGFVDLDAIDFSGFAGENTLFGSISKLVDSFKGFGMSDKQLEAFHAFLDSLDGAGSTLNDVLAQFGIKPDRLSGLLGLFQALAKIKVMFSAADFIADVAGVFKVGKSLAGMFDSIGSAAKAYKKNLQAQTFKDIATGILMIAGSMALLSLIDPGRLVKVAACMAVVIAAVAFLFMQFNDYKQIMSQLDGGAVITPLQTMAEGLKDALSKFAKIAAIGIAVIGVALGLVLIAKAILMFTDILSDGNCKKGIAAAIVVVGGLVLIAALLAKVSDGLVGLGTAFLGLAEAVLIISFAINRFKDIDKSALDTAIQVMIAVGGVIAVLMMVRAMTGSDLMGLAGTILGLAAAVLIMGFAVKKIGDMKEGRFKGLAVIAGLLAAMAGAIWLIGRLPVDENEGAAVTNAAQALMSVADAMKSLAIVMVIIGKIGVKDIWALAIGFGAMVVPIIAIGVALKLINKFIPDADKSANAVLTMAKAMTMLSAAMIIMALVPTDMLKKGGIALIVIAASLGAVLAATKLMSDANVTATLIALGVAFGVLVAAMIAIGKLMSGGELAVGIIGILAPLGLLIGALAILSLLGKPLTAVGLAFFLFGAGLLMAAGAIAIFGLAIPALFTNLAAAAPKAVEAINAFGNAIWEGLCSFGSWLLQNGPSLMLSLLESFFNSIIPGIAGLPWGDIFVALWNGVMAIGAWLGEKLGSAADWLGLSLYRMIMGAETWLRGGIASMLSGFLDLIVEAFGDIPGIGPWLKERGEEAKESLNGWVNTASTKLDELNKEYEEKYGKINDTVKNANEEAKTAQEERLANIKQTNVEIAEQMAKDAEAQGRYDLAAQIRAQAYGAKAAYEETTPEVSSAAEGFYKAASGSINIDISSIGSEGIKTLLGSMLNTDAFNGVGGENIMAFVGGLKDGMTTDEISGLASGLGMDLDAGTIQGIQEKLPDVLSVISSLGGDSIDKLRETWDSHSPSVAFQNIGRDATLGVRNGFIIGRPLVLAAIGNFGNGIITAFGKLPSQMNKSATKAMLGYVLALRARGKDAKKAASDVGIASANAASKYSAFYTTGRHCVQGLIDGIRSKTREARQAATDLGNAVSAATANSVKVASPSRVFFSIGAFIVAGLVNAIVQNAFRAQRAAEDMGDDTVGAVVNAMAMLGRITDEDINYTPTITPVVDLSAAQFGFTRLNAMSDNLQLSVDSAINSKWAELEAMYERLNGMQVGTDNSDIVAAIESLKGDVAALGESMANMKVVLNRRIVGQIDNGLGQQQLLANRGV